MLPNVSPSRSFKPNAWKKVILPRLNMLGTSQFQSSCIGQARISDYTSSNSMATNGINVKIQFDFIL